jgi:hypothetical protein
MNNIKSTELFAARLYTEADKKLLHQVQELAAKDSGGEIQYRQLFKVLAANYLQVKREQQVKS